MQPIAENIPLLACYDPVAAYGIAMQVPRVPFFMNATGTFNSFALNQIPIEGDLDTTISSRVWISKINYSLQQPNVFNGQILKTLYDAMLKAQPGISVRVTVQSGPKYLVCPEFTPLENFTNSLDERWPAGWPIFKQQSIRVEYELTQAPPSTTPNGPPYTVTTTFMGWQFVDWTIDEMDPDWAAARLREMGFKLPDRMLYLPKKGG